MTKPIANIENVEDLVALANSFGLIVHTVKPLDWTIGRRRDRHIGTKRAFFIEWRHAKGVDKLWEYVVEESAYIAKKNARGQS